MEDSEKQPAKPSGRRQKGGMQRMDTRSHTDKDDGSVGEDVGEPGPGGGHRLRVLPPIGTKCYMSE